jgi:amino acid/peptide:H+ symporter
MNTTATPTRVREGHPPGLYVLFFTEMWERFSYYGMRAILLLFLLDKVNGGMALGEGEGGAIYGLYTFSVYLLSLPGGWLADNVLGQRKAIWYGGLIIMLGHIVLAVPTASPGVFFSGLGLVAIGTGLLKPNISSIVSELYPEGGARRDAAFSIFYMGINLGSFLGITIVGYLGQKVGWHYGFGAAAVAVGLGMIVYRTLGPRYLGERGLYPKVAETNPDGSAIAVNPLSWVLLALLVGFLLTLQFGGYFAWDSKKAVATSMGVVAIATVVVYFANLLLASGLSVTERKHVGVLIALFVGAVLFWTGFEQQGSSFQIFADRYSVRLAKQLVSEFQPGLHPDFCSHPGQSLDLAGPARAEPVVALQIRDRPGVAGLRVRGDGNRSAGGGGRSWHGGQSVGPVFGRHLPAAHPGRVVPESGGAECLHQTVAQAVSEPVDGHLVCGGRAR